MGISGLLKYIRQLSSSRDCAAAIELSCFEAKYIKNEKMRLAIDFSCLLHTTVACIRSYNGIGIKNSKGTDISWVIPLCQKLVNLISYDIDLVIVFDGKSDSMKDGEKLKRKERKEKLKEEIDTISDKNGVEFKKKYAQVYVPTEDEFALAKIIVNLLGIPYIQAEGEGDPVCAWLTYNKYVSGTISEDSDMLPLNCKLLFTNATRFMKDDSGIFVYNLDKILTRMGISYKQFVAFCVLCGTDYNSNLPGIGPATAHKKIKELGSLDKFLKNYIDTHDINENTKEIIDKMRQSYNYFLNYDMTYFFENLSDRLGDSEKLGNGANRNKNDSVLGMQCANIPALENFLYYKNGFNKNDILISKFIAQLVKTNKKYKFPENSYEYTMTKTKNEIIKPDGYIEFQDETQKFVNTISDLIEKE